VKTILDTKDTPDHLRVLPDDETRERLLDQSVLNDFYFEEKLKERKQQMIQE
jgi:hypothetical protein